MDKLTKGTWIVNTTKHISDVKTVTQELAYYEATERAGKAGALLGRLVADQQEIITYDTAKAFARQSSISPDAVDTYLKILRNAGKVDYSSDSLDNIKEIEIYCFSGTSALETVADVYGNLNPSQEEQASLNALHATYELPRYEDEVMELLTESEFSEAVARNTIQLQKVFGLVKTSGDSASPILYNEYAFTGDPQRTIKALDNLSTEERDNVQEVLQLVMDSQGFLREAMPANIRPDIVTMMEGVGLLDGITVRSPYGEATYYTTPQLRGQGVGTFSLSEDVFHKAKILLGCLRFGQTKSNYGRGKIDTQQKMLNIVNKLLRGDWTGPCTAIGQDYQLLEIDGVIETQPANYGMFFMKLRQIEVGKLAVQMLSHNKVVPEADVNVQEFLKEQPSDYIIPEARKQFITARATQPVKELREKLLNSIRTGGR
jgi:hypothetical protein